MHIVSPVLAELNYEGASTQKMLERVPREHFDWQPHAKSMSLGTLAWHIATIPKTIARFLDAGEFDLNNARPGSTPPPDADVIAEYQRNLDELRARIKTFDDDTIRQPFTLRRGDQVVQTITRMVMLRNIFMNHSIHHRGQLSVYLRMLDVPLPAMYGTTADETQA